MDINPMIVKEYLESLNEKDELNRIFPMLLEAMGFEILTKPTEYLGLQEYGKDIIAIGKDTDGIKKRFYFELKGGDDRNITEKKFHSRDGISNSLLNSRYKKFISAYPKFEKLNLIIVVVHNGIVKGNVQSLMEEMFVELSTDEISFERWDISRLTKLFNENLFGAYLLVDEETTRLFNRTLVNLNSSDGISNDFVKLINYLFTKYDWASPKRGFPKKWKLQFESFKLISFIIYTEAKKSNNFETAKKYLTHSILRFWLWILKNKLENDKKVMGYFMQSFLFYYKVLAEYFNRTIDVAFLKDGLFSEHGGRYEQVGYAMRTFEYLQYYCFVLNVNRHIDSKFNYDNAKLHLVKLINSNSVSARPLLDMHSIPIIDTLLLLIKFDAKEEAKAYLNNVLAHIKWGKENHDRLPDASNSIENVVKFIITGEKSVFYSDSTSPLLAVLMEFVAILDMEDVYYGMKKFINSNNIELGIFVPHHGLNSVSRDLIKDEENDLEEQLFSKSVLDGYQSQLKLKTINIENIDFNEELSFKDFKDKIKRKMDEFEYNYRTDNAQFPFLKDLAHIYFRTPYFPDKWRAIDFQHNTKS